VRGTAERTSATSCLRSAAARSTRRWMILGRSRARPAPTTNDTRFAVVGDARPPRRSSTIAWRFSAGRAWSVSVVRSSSEPSRVRANRNSSSSTSPRVPSARATSKRSSAYASVRAGALASGTLRAHLVDVVLDQLHLGVVVEVALDDLLGQLDRERGHARLQVGQRAIGGRSDVVLGPLADSRRLFLRPAHEVLAHGVGGL